MHRGRPGRLALAVAMAAAVVGLAAPSAEGAPHRPGPGLGAQPSGAGPPAEPGTVIVRFRPGLSAPAAKAVADRHGLRIERPIGATGHFRVSTQGRSPAAAVRSLRGDGRVLHADLNHQVKVAAVPNDPRFSTQQGYLSNLGLPTAWDRSRGSATVPVAVVDTGVDLDHPDLAGRILPGWDFVTGPPGGMGDSVAQDDNGHGTLVAGVAGAATDNAKGVAGAAWETRIIPVKVLDADGSGWVDDAAAGITWAADNGARVVNLSFGNPYGDAVLRAAVDYARSLDVVVVAAAGNECSTQPFYPAAYPGVVGVTATDHDGRFAGPPNYSCGVLGTGFSNSGPWVTLSAPGMGITSTALGPAEQYGTVEGTSFSAPIVSGAAVLLRASQPGLTESQVVARLRDTARDAGPPGFDDQYGYGLADPTAALGGTPYPPLTAPAEGEFHPLPPARVLDTRNGTGGVTGALGAGDVLSLRVRGVGGVPPSGVSAVVMNVTVTEPSAPSFVTVYPSGEPRPLASNLNFVAGQTVPNLVQVKVSADGWVDFYNAAGRAHLVADVAGWYSDASGTRGSRFHPLTPSRLLDTRRDPAGALGPGQVRNLAVTGRGGVPPSGVSSVVMNVTVTEPTAPSFLTVYGAGSRRPLASNLNFVAGQTVPNLVVSGVGPSPPGQISLYNAAGRVHVVVDVVGWYGDESNGPGRLYRPMSPARIADTRDGTGGVVGRLGPAQSVGVAAAGRGGVPAHRVSAVVSNVTVTEPSAPSFLTVYPSGEPRPLASNLNFLAGQTVPNLVTAKVGSDGRLATYNAAGSTHVVFDAFGWFTG